MQRGQEVHDIWAVDAKERIPLEDGTWASWLAISDEASGAILYTAAFPQRYWGQLDVILIREQLQQAFVQWGLPRRLRFDNGYPWGTYNAVPTDMSLWLVGLGLQVLFGRPARSTDNAVVERAHGVLNAWVEPRQRTDFADLQQGLAYFTRWQRERYPVSDGQTRLMRYPELQHNPRRYEPQADRQMWSLQAVYNYLACFRFQRKVTVTGVITLLNRTYSVGRALYRRTIAVQMDPTTWQWVVYDDYGRPLKHLAPKGLTYETLFDMTLAQRRKK